jgi:cell division protein YceG involved in septum cleavage
VACYRVKFTFKFTLLLLLLLLLLSLLLQLSCHSVAVVLTPVQTKQIRINIHKRYNTKSTVQTIQNALYQNTHTLHVTATVQDTHQMK